MFDLAVAVWYHCESKERNNMVGKEKPYSHEHVISASYEVAVLSNSLYVVTNQTMSDYTVQCMLENVSSTIDWQSQETRFGLLCLLCSILMVLLVSQEAVYKTGNASSTTELTLRRLYSHIYTYIFTTLNQIYFFFRLVAALILIFPQHEGPKRLRHG